MVPTEEAINVNTPLQHLHNTPLDLHKSPTANEHVCAYGLVSPRHKKPRLPVVLIGP